MGAKALTQIRHGLPDGEVIVFEEGDDLSELDPDVVDSLVLGGSAEPAKKPKEEDVDSETVAATTEEKAEKDQAKNEADEKKAAAKAAAEEKK